MGFHCGNTCIHASCHSASMKYQMIMARSLPIEVTQGTLEGDIKPGDITFFRLQSTADNVLRAYIAHGEVLPVATRSFGAIGIFAIPEMGRFYRHVLIEKNFPHHGAVAFGHYGKALLRSIQIHRSTSRRNRLQPAKRCTLPNRKSLGLIKTIHNHIRGGCINPPLYSTKKHELKNRIYVSSRRFNVLRTRL